jgi:AcrR family transcriptional regulator
MTEDPRDPATPKKSQKEDSRPKGQTRDVVLASAERLFAFSGFDGTTIREIASDAGVQLALVGYHFGRKEQLFEHVMQHRARVMGTLRLELLSEARANSDNGLVSIEDLVRAYVWPFLERSANGGSGWKSHAKLIARIANSPRWAPLIAHYYNEVAAVFVQEMFRSLPDVEEKRVYNGFTFMVGTMLTVCAETGRIDTLSLGKAKTGRLESIFEDMLPFLTAGFHALPGAGSPHSAAHP